jgi:cytochrome c oxidase subunit I+III
LASLLVLTPACIWLRRTLTRLRRSDDAALARNLGALALLGLLQSALLLWALLDAELSPRAMAHDAVISVLLGYALLHCLLASLLTALQVARVGYGYVGAHAPYEPLVVGQLWYYNLGVLWSGFCALVLFPMSWGGV